jgi:S1-C subfamily serine protease
VLGDVITEVAGQPIGSNNDFYDVLESVSPGDTITIRTRRGDEAKSFQVKVVESQ